MPGSSPAYSRILDRVDIATGGGADGEGELVPPPLSPTLQPSYFSPATPPHPRLRRSAPAPRKGQGQCLRYQGSSRTRGVAGGQPCPALSHLSSGTGPCGYRHRGRGRRGGGTCSPSPVSHAPDTLLLPATPIPTRDRDSARAYTWWAAVPREQRWRRFFWRGRGGDPGPGRRASGAVARTSPGQVFPQKSFERLFHPEDVPNPASVAARARGTPHPGSASQVSLTPKTIRFCDFSYFAG